MMSFLVDQVAEKYAGRIKIGKVNVAEEGGLAEQHNIVSLPTLVIYQYGAIFQQKVGGVSKQDLENFFKDVV
jgi:thioredoxin 1